MILKEKDIFDLLDEKAEYYNSPDFITDDPIQIPHRFSLKQDIEIGGFLSASIAWGNRKSIINDANKKRICMRVNLSHTRLILSTFVQKDTEEKRRAIKTPKPYSKKRSLMRLLKHIVFVNEKENNDYKGETHVG